LISRILEVLPSETTFVCATTGTAALLIGGMTVHHWSGVGLGAGIPQQLLATVEANPSAVFRWKKTSHLIVDEISMLSANLFSALDFIGRCVRGVDKVC
jgi:ATP-dependent DNA helicase PIF1